MYLKIGTFLRNGADIIVYIGRMNKHHFSSFLSSHNIELLYCFLTFHLCVSLLNVQNNTSVLKKKGNPDRKTFAM